MIAFDSQIAEQKNYLPDSRRADSIRNNEYEQTATVLLIILQSDAKGDQAQTFSHLIAIVLYDFNSMGIQNRGMRMEYSF